MLETYDKSGKPPKLVKSSANNSTQGHKQSQQVMRITKKYEFLVHLNLTKSTSDTCRNGPSLVAFEVKPEALLLQLPPSLRQKKFGLM